MAGRAIAPKVSCLASLPTHTAGQLQPFTSVGTAAAKVGAATSVLTRPNDRAPPVGHATLAVAVSDAANSAG